MSSPKALLSLPTGETLLDYHVVNAKRLGCPVFIADNQQGFAASQNIFDSQVQAIADYCPPPPIPDSTPSDHPKNEHSIGPLGAILSTQQQLTVTASTNDATDPNNPNNLSKIQSLHDKWLLVVSCDSLVNAEEIWQLLAKEVASTEQTNSQAVDSEQAKSVICITDHDNLYPLLGLYRLDLVDPLKTYIDSGQRRVMRFIHPISQTVQMPASWRNLSNLNTPEQFRCAVSRFKGHL